MHWQVKFLFVIKKDPLINKNTSVKYYAYINIKFKYKLLCFQIVECYNSFQG